MDFAALLFGALLLAMPLLGAALLAILIRLERPEPMSSPAAANGAPEVRRRSRRSAARRRR